MGLDWHAVVQRTHAEMVSEAQLEYPNLPLEEALGRVSQYAKPCALVGAGRLGSRPDFRERVEEIWRCNKEAAAKLVADPAELRHYTGFVDYWYERTLEAELDSRRDRWDCDNCPLLRALAGADSVGNFFLGITVSSCDFRGKIVSNCGLLPGDVRDAAYRDRDAHSMLEYAGELESCAKDLPSDEAQRIEMAVRWLRVCASHGVGMVAGY